jgi:hypothetical protein
MISLKELESPLKMVLSATALFLFASFWAENFD